ncbi:MAG: carboxypeptidase M32 [Clostridia bacterium]|nr:carboxypeptidase M32 [Clostridia bacterium]
MERLKKLKEYLKNIENLNYTTSVLRWEMDTIAPKSSYNYLIDVSTKYELESFKLSTSSDFIKLVEDVINSEEYEQLNEMQKRYIQKLKSDYYQFSRIPEDFYKEYCELVNNSLNAWVEAKNKSNYSIFKPYLIKVIESTKKYYSYMYPDANNLYDCMLNDYEEGITTCIIDKLFNELKEKIVPIIKNLQSKELTTINTKLNDSQLIEISKFMLDYIGFDNSRGALGIYTHGYTMKLNNNDVRISFSNKNVITDILSTVIHEGGHGIFEQNIDESLANIPAYDINKCALHESQSRFFENILGRNVNFWVPIYKEVKEKLKIEMTIDEFIEQFNNAKPSFIRTEADELTYCMHIIIRYEIEKDIFNDKIDLEELPNIWNKKYKEYLGLDVTSDKDGILQDMHWSEGAFGYFPSYLVGSIFDGMLLETVNKNLGNVNDLLKNGNIKEITKFLNNNIHRYGGAYNINEIANKVCGKDLEIEPLVKYFSEKYE